MKKCRLSFLKVRRNNGAGKLHGRKSYYVVIETRIPGRLLLASKRLLDVSQIIPAIENGVVHVIGPSEGHILRPR